MSRKGSALFNARLLKKEDNWFRDQDGRYVMFRGVNFGSRSKLPPYLPISPLGVTTITPQELSKEINSVARELDLMKECGFSAVRLPISWKAIEPRPNPNLEELLPEGEGYLRLVTQIVDELYSRGLLVFLDFHQDIASDVCGGDGFPDWALAITKETKEYARPPKYNKMWAASYMMNKLVKNTLYSFWHNDLTNEDANLKNYPVRTHLEKTIGQTARFFKTLNNGQGHPAIVGVDVFNEPHPVGIDKLEFESQLLKEYYLNAFNEISKYDDKLFVFIEPRVDWTAFSSEEMNKQLSGWDKVKKLDLRRFLQIGDMEMVRTPLDRDTYTTRDLMRSPKKINTYLPARSEWPSKFLERGVFSFHYYDTFALMAGNFKIPVSMSQYRQDWPDVFEKIVAAGYERDLIPFLSEFGGTQDSEQIAPYINLQYIQVESQLLNSTYWNYDLYNTKKGKDNWNLENFSLLGPGRKPRWLDLATRPYPILSSAKPIALTFEPKKKYFILALHGAPVESPTVIYVPQRTHYRKGFYVWCLTGADSIQWYSDDQLLYWKPFINERLNMVVITEKDEVKVKDLSKEVKVAISRDIGAVQDLSKGTIEELPAQVQKFFENMRPFGKFK
ncbi:MAG TPA: cellulase family glycosylhydrolase [Nitrososphaeraceae archaeon]|nr:cellulase family glycosylhydrolase [Nitrososphaeraceae archaeon]